jgi:hypothetical protein
MERGADAVGEEADRAADGVMGLRAIPSKSLPTPQVSPIAK